MRPSLVPILLLAATQLFAQAPPSGRPPRPEPGDVPRTLWRDTEHSLDEIRRRQGADAPLLKSPKLVEAIHTYRPGRLPELLVTWGEFITADGLQFLAFQFSTSMTPKTRAVAFGEFTDERGAVILSFEEPLGVQQSKNDTYLERSLIVPSAHMTLTVGVVASEEILAMNRISIDQEELTKIAPSISRLLLSNNLYTMTAAQKPLDPFAFGGTKVVPKPDRTFRRGDEVWLFTELRNPTLDPQRLPRVTTKVELESAGKKIALPLMTADAAPLKGVDRHYGVGQSIDTSALAAGEYTIRYTVRDTLANLAYVREGTFRVTD